MARVIPLQFVTHHPQQCRGNGVDIPNGRARVILAAAVLIDSGDVQAAILIRAAKTQAQDLAAVIGLLHLAILLRRYGVHSGQMNNKRRLLRDLGRSRAPAVLR